MSEDKITLNDVKEYEKFFTMVPPFLLERFAKKNTNIVLKFKSRVDSFLANLSDHQRNKLDILLKSDIEELQDLMVKAYAMTNKKQYRILGNPKYRPFVESNLNEVRKLIEE